MMPRGKGVLTSRRLSSLVSPFGVLAILVSLEGLFPEEYFPGTTRPVFIYLFKIIIFF